MLFDHDQHSIRSDAQTVLQKQAAWLKQYPQAKLMVEGHCDERGTREYNLALGDRRAYAVKEFLVSLGVDAARLQTKSYGKERPALQRIRRQLLAAKPPRLLRHLRRRGFLRRQAHEA